MFCEAELPAACPKQTGEKRPMPPRAISTNIGIRRLKRLWCIIKKLDPFLAARNSPDVLVPMQVSALEGKRTPSKGLIRRFKSLVYPMA